MKKFPLLFLVLFTACSLDVKQLIGHWQAVAFFENGQSLAAPLDSVALTFAENGYYEFRSIGFYREAGPFRLDGKLLFLNDTTQKPAKERTLKVLFLSADTLKIQMQKAGQEQVLFFKKTQ
jgi:hypothetical protein